MIVGIDKESCGFPKSVCTITFHSNTGHTDLLVCISTINPFKQPQCALELKLLNLLNSKNFISLTHSLPGHNNQPTA